MIPFLVKIYTLISFFKDFTTIRVPLSIYRIMAS